MTSNRLAGRDVHIHDANNPTVLLGGLSLAPCITNAGFLSMLEMVLIFKDDNYHLKNQDGVLQFYWLGTTIHFCQGTTMFSDNHKVGFFVPNDEGIGGKCLDQTFLNKPDRPPDELLLWHFRQAVLANMRDAGEPLFEHDFHPGSDIMGEISEGPKAAERMEFELSSRLSSVPEATALDETMGEASAI
ncbi:hypothetical protein MMC07_006234 [Pseudocyphellaria aurata]|nr:hypothetical protein [Pseudocyphellaria aurata]